MLASPARMRISARANVVLPAPRSPDSVTRSPGSSAAATSAANRCVAPPSGSVSVKLAPPGPVRSMDVPLPRRAQPGGFGEWECTGDSGALSHRGSNGHRAAVEFHEGTNQRKADSGTAMLRSQRVRLEPVEDLF